MQGFMSDMPMATLDDEVKSAGVVETMEIEIDQIDENPDNAKIFSMDNIEVLARNIEKDGFTTTITVFRKEDGRYEISSGHRRYRAMKYLGRKKISCVVSEMPNRFVRGRRLIFSNTLNRDLSPMDRARVVKYLEEIMKEEKEAGEEGAYEGRLRDAVAAELGWSASSVHRYEKLNELIPELQELADTPAYPYAAFSKANKLTKDNQKYLRDLLVKRTEELNRDNGYSLNGEERSLKTLTTEDIRQEISLLLRKQEREEEKEQANAELTDTKKASIVPVEFRAEIVSEEETEESENDPNGLFDDFSDDHSDEREYVPLPWESDRGFTVPEEKYEEKSVETVEETFKEAEEIKPEEIDEVIRIYAEGLMKTTNKSNIEIVDKDKARRNLERIERSVEILKQLLK